MMKRKNHGLLRLLGDLVTKKITLFTGGSDMGFVDAGEDADIMEGANCATSRRLPRWDGDAAHRHALLIDLDVPAYLVPSTTPGHSHLYIDVSISDERYWELLRALAKAGVIEEGYFRASMEKGATYLRLPWVKKAEPTAVTIPEPCF